MKNQAGFAPVVILILVVIVLAVVGYFGMNKFNISGKGSPSPSAIPITQAVTENSEKQKMYEENKEKIKADLHLTEQQFQTLKRFSGE